MKTIGIIPARFASSRFPGKPLALILGKSLIQHTYENALRCKELSKVIVATDDDQIFKHVHDFGGEAVMTSTTCANGTERIFDAVNRFPLYADYDLIVNIQGDEPCIDPETITKVIGSLKNDVDSVVATPITTINHEDEFLNPATVKCVKSLKNQALYFSRSPIPHAARHGDLKGLVNYRHIGLYAFRKEFLKTYVSLDPTPLQMAESLEQLKILEHGFKISVVLVDHTGIDVNDPQDIQKVEKYLCQQNSSL